MSLRLNGRVGVDLGASDVWPGIEPAVQLIEAYAEYAQPVFTVRGGRQLLANRLGTLGFDGGRVTSGRAGLGLEAEVYAGLGLARATAIPVTSPVLNPLDDFQPSSRQILAGAAVGYSRAEIDVRADYQRELDGDTRNFVSERAALSLDLRPLPRWSLESGVDYDLANTWFGNADAVVRYTSPRITVRRAHGCAELMTKPLAAALIAVCFAALAAAQQDLPPPFPRTNATKLLENDRINVWDIVWPKGQPTALHRHIYDQVGTYYARGGRIDQDAGRRRPEPASPKSAASPRRARARRTSRRGTPIRRFARCSSS